VDAYKQETEDIVRRFRQNHISHAECVAALDAAVVRVVQRITPAELPSVRFEIRRNYGLISGYSLKSRPGWPLAGDTATLQ